jgi:hypothetical protein
MKVEVGMGMEKGGGERRGSCDAFFLLCGSWLLMRCDA